MLSSIISPTGIGNEHQGSDEVRLTIGSFLDEHSGLVDGMEARDLTKQLPPHFLNQGSTHRYHGEEE